MALIYAFDDDLGFRHGEPDEGPPLTKVDFTPISGPFAGRTLRLFIAQREGGVGDTWVTISEQRGYHLTHVVEELLQLGPAANVRVVTWAEIEART